MPCSPCQLGHTFCTVRHKSGMIRVPEGKTSRLCARACLSWKQLFCRLHVTESEQIQFRNYGLGTAESQTQRLKSNKIPGES